MSKRRWLCLFVLASIAASASCIFRGPEGIRKELSRESGVELKREFGITVGRTGMLLAKMITATAPGRERTRAATISTIQKKKYHAPWSTMDGAPMARSKARRSTDIDSGIVSVNL